jgi:hypothetical protein
MFKGKKILIISPESWGINFVSKHHFALQLSKGDSKVYFLNPPGRHNRLTKLSNNLFLIDYKSLFRGLSKLPSFFSGFLTKIELEKIELVSRQQFDIIWNFDSSRFFNLKYIHKLKITHLVDYYENLNRSLLCKTSDICLCTSNFIYEKIMEYNVNVHNIGHGYQNSKIELSETEYSILEDSEFKIKACYIGNLSIKYIDWMTILDIVKSHSEVGFYFIGPEGKSNISRSKLLNQDMLEVKKRKNTFFIGQKDPPKVISFLERMDILLLIYKANDFREQLSNPHKLLEYIGSGKITLSSWTDEYSSKTQLLEMVFDNSEMVEKFSEILANLDYFNCPKMQKERKRYARANSYEKKIQQIEKLIKLRDIK